MPKYSMAEYLKMPKFSKTNCSRKGLELSGFMVTSHLVFIWITQMFLIKTYENTEMFSAILNCSYHFCEIAMHKDIGFF